jgi:hypothetical protein
MPKKPVSAGEPDISVDFKSEIKQFEYREELVLLAVSKWLPHVVEKKHLDGRLIQ